MKRVGNLLESVVSFENIMAAAKKAFRGKKSKASVASFYFHLEKEVIRLQEELVSGTYRPRPYRIFEIREPKVRQICSSDFRDRVVHHAICNLIDPILERRLIWDTYACRVGKGAHSAVKRAQFFANNYAYFLKCDISKYFQSIDHEVLKSLLRGILKDEKLLSMIDIIIDHSVPGNSPGKGIPIGNLTSQHFANFYLGELDHFLKEECRIKGYLRYMDDFICFADDKHELLALVKKIRFFLAEKLKLVLKEKVTRIAPVQDGIPFLGFRIFPNLIRIQRANLIRLRRKIKRREREFEMGLITESELSDSVRSMIAHIQHSNSHHVRRKEFEASLSLA